LFVDEKVGEREQPMRHHHLLLRRQLDRRIEQRMDGGDGAAVVAAVVGVAPLVERLLGVARRAGDGGRRRGGDGKEHRREHRGRVPHQGLGASPPSGWSATFCTRWSLARSSTDKVCEAWPGADTLTVTVFLPLSDSSGILTSSGCPERKMLP